MHADYMSGSSRKKLSEKFKFEANSIYLAFKRYGLYVRSCVEAGLLSARSRTGDNHWRRRNPSPIQNKYYRSRRIVDADGKTHKRRVHVILMEEHIGRRLLPKECVHHINGDRHDNRFENLRLMTKSEHARMEALAAHAKEPHKFIRKHNKKTGRFLPQPHLPWSAYNPNSLMSPSLRKAK